MNHRRAARRHVQTPPQKTSPGSAALMLIRKVWGGAGFALPILKLAG